MTNTTANRRRIKREGPDYYPTPAWAIRALLAYEAFDGSISEPCCGEGYMARALIDNGCHTVAASDLYDYGYGKPFVNASSIGPVDNIITNPPYNAAHDMVAHFISVARKKVAILVRMAFLESKRRYSLFVDHPPASVYVFSERLSFAPAGQVVKGGGTVSHCWIVWDRASQLTTQLHWIAPGFKKSGLE